MVNLYLVGYVRSIYSSLVLGTWANCHESYPNTVKRSERASRWPAAGRYRYTHVHICLLVALSPANKRRLKFLNASLTRVVALLII